MQVNTWRTIGASVIGTSHQQYGIPCQDAHQVCILPCQTLLIAIADGAGSAKRATDGSRVAVTAVVDAIRTILKQDHPTDANHWQQVLVDAFTASRNALVGYAVTEHMELRAFATTLTCVLATDQWLAVGQIGDGVVVAHMEDGQLFTVIHPQRGEYANETYFLTMTNAIQYMEIHVIQMASQSLAVMTDGILRLALTLPSYEPYAPFFYPLFAFVAEEDDLGQAQTTLAAFLSSQRVCDCTDDDKTLVLATQFVGSYQAKS